MHNCFGVTISRGYLAPELPNAILSLLRLNCRFSNYNISNYTETQSKNAHPRIMIIYKFTLIKHRDVYNISVQNMSKILGKIYIESAIAWQGSASKRNHKLRQLAKSIGSTMAQYRSLLVSHHTCKLWASVVLMLGQRRRRWPNTSTTLDQRRDVCWDASWLLLHCTFKYREMRAHEGLPVMTSSQRGNSSRLVTPGEGERAGEQFVVFDPLHTMVRGVISAQNQLVLVGIIISSESGITHVNSNLR